MLEQKVPVLKRICSLKIKGKQASVRFRGIVVMIDFKLGLVCIFWFHIVSYAYIVLYQDRAVSHAVKLFFTLFFAKLSITRTIDTIMERFLLHPNMPPPIIPNS